MITRDPYILLEAISDGAWHKINDLTKTINISRENLSPILVFFEKFGFIEISADEECIKIDRDYTKL
jgi:hypothetical protein